MAAHCADGGVFRHTRGPIAAPLCHKKSAADAKPAALNLPSFYQAKLTLVLTLRRRRMAAPTRPKPEIIIAQAAGSGTAV